MKGSLLLPVLLCGIHISRGNPAETNGEGIKVNFKESPTFPMEPYDVVYVPRR